MTPPPTADLGPDFSLLCQESIPELRGHLTVAKHQHTGMRIVHLQTPDPENLFGISLRTEPDDDTGVAHILEHLVLCGSENYPVRDPFMSMSRRSLNTFMNAFTGPDFTVYPAASLVPRDFDHLLMVYIDAVFRPLLTETGFRQEGWRLECTDPVDPSSPLLFRGVVYNEMKGALTSPDARMWHHLMQALFPDLTYRWQSGGDPAAIPELSHAALRRFHQTFYHPSQAILFLYGDRPLSEHCAFLRPLLADLPSAEPLLPPMPLQKRLQAPRALIETFPSDRAVPPLLAISWLTCTCDALDEILLLELLLLLLFGTDAAPLKRTLLGSGLCRDVDAALSEEMREVPFTVVFRGLPEASPEESAQQLEALLLEALHTQVREGFALSTVLGAFDQMQLQKLEISGDEGPYGLHLLMRVVLPMQHGADPAAIIRVRQAVEQLRSRLESDPNLLTRTLERWLIDEPHRVRLLMLPSGELANEEARAEQEMLDQRTARLSPQDRQALVVQAAELAALQEEEEDTSCLPMLSLGEVPKEVPRFELVQEALGPHAVHRHETFTNGMVYVDLYLPFALPEQSALAGCLSALQWVPELGFGGRPYTSTLHELLAYTGGISVGFSLYCQADDPTTWRPALHVRGKALERHAERLIELMAQMRRSTDWSDLPRLRELVEQAWSYAETSLSRLAPRLASGLATAQVCAAAAVDVQVHGMGYLHWLQDTHTLIQHQPQRCAEELAHWMRALQQGPAEVVITAEEAGHSRLHGEVLQPLLEGLLPVHEPLKTPEISLWPSTPYPFKMEGRVAYIRQSLATVPYDHPLSPCLAIAAELMQNTVLHPRVREQGGAYGASAQHNAVLGCFSMGSYRDPHIRKTLEAMRSAVTQVAAGAFDAEDLLEAQFSVLQQFEGLPSPGARGHTMWQWLRSGRSPAVRELWKGRAMEADAKDICHAVETLLLPDIERLQPVIVAGEEVLRREGFREVIPLHMHRYAERELLES